MLTGVLMAAIGTVLAMLAGLADQPTPSVLSMIIMGITFAVVSLLIYRSVTPRKQDKITAHEPKTLGTAQFRSAIWLNPQILYEKVLDGDPMSDNELEQALEFFTRIERDLQALGPRFHLSFAEANRVLRTLRQQHTSRSGKET